ncbi:MAG: YSC84-related protein [Chthoniobacteraceae bacterium]
MKTLLPYLMIAALMAAAPALKASEQDQVAGAATTIRRFKAIPEKSIPPQVMRDAKGLAILTVVKGAFIFSGRIGQGVVVARTADGWSGPSFIKTGGAGFGAQIGGQVTEFVIVLNTRAAVRAFAHGGNVQLGGALSVAAGPYGRATGADVTPKAAIYTYSRNQGLFAGVSLEGTVIVTDNSGNADYYGHDVTPHGILSGKVTPPARAAVLTRALQR